MKKLWAVALLTLGMFCSKVAGQSTVFYTDRAVGVFPVLPSGQAVLVPIQYGQVRVCTFPAVGSPCTPVAAITDINGNPLSISGGNFGQLSTDVVGRFSFGCTPGLYQVQVAASGSNTPQLNYPVTCPSGSSALLSSNNIWTALQTFSAGIVTSPLNGLRLTTTPPTGSTLGMGDQACLNQIQTTTVNDLMIPCKDFSSGIPNTFLGVTGLYAGASMTGTNSNAGVFDGASSLAAVYGTFTDAATATLIAQGYEGTVNVSSTGGQIFIADGLEGDVNTFGSSTGINYMASYYGALNSLNNGSTGTVTGNFSAIFELQTFGTEHLYSVWEKGSQLQNNGTFIDWMFAPTSATSLSMSGCPVCVVTVADAAHGLTTGDMVQVSPQGAAGGIKQQYEGYYVVTVDNANQFHYTAIVPYSSNAATITSANINKIPGIAHFLGVDSINQFIIGNPALGNSANGAVQFKTSIGTFLAAGWNGSNAIVRFDPANIGFVEEFSTTAGWRFAGGPDQTGSTGSGSNEVTDVGATINTPTINETHLLISPTAPTIAGGGCGGSSAAISINNGTAAFTINVATAPTTACTVTMPAATNDWVCSAIDVTTNSTTVFLQKLSATASTSITITNYSDVAVASNFTANDKIKVSCFAE
jgi:hypothetical protein